MILNVDISDRSAMQYTESVYQHDKNVTIVLTGDDLPEKYEIVFSNQKERGISIACEGTPAGVVIPDALLSTGDYVYAWVRTGNETDKDYYTLCSITIPVIPRPVPIPVQTSSETEFKYRIDAENEDLEFFGKPNEMLIPNIEPEN